MSPRVGGLIAIVGISLYTILVGVELRVVRKRGTERMMMERAEEIGATILRTDQMGTIEIISDGRS